MQGILALNVNRLGMSLMRMDKESESVRFLDDVDLTFSLDNRLSSHRQMTSIDATINPVVFRASYQDINMIMAIVNKAILLYGSSQQSSTLPKGEREPSSRLTTARVAVSYDHPKSKARVLTTKEMVRLNWRDALPS
jgi:vacuolar protein sorting-associated protein 13A/C